MKITKELVYQTIKTWITGCYIQEQLELCYEAVNKLLVERFSEENVDLLAHKLYGMIEIKREEMACIIS